MIKQKFAATVFLFCLFSASANFSSPAATQTAPASTDNPFFRPYGTPFNVPPFQFIKNEHFLPAIEEGIKREQAEIDAVINNPEASTFENTIAAYDHAGIFLSDVNSVFGSIQSANTNKELQALARKTAPMLAAHRDNIRLNEKLFRRVKAVYDMRNTLKLDRATALSFRKNVLEPFGTEDPMTQHVRFRGAEPKIDPLLRKRGLEVASQN